jgi:hypothetical protein
LTEGITGTGIDLNGTTGALGGSTTFQDFEGTAGGNPDADTDDNDVLKIASIGFITETTTTSDADLAFTFSNIDADGDATATQTLNVHIEGSTTFVGTAEAETVEGTAGDDSLTGGAGNDFFVLEVTNGGHDDILDFVSGSDQILVDIGDGLTIGTAATLAAANFHTGDETAAATWDGGTGNEFVFNDATNELWYSANGTGNDLINLASIATGIPVATDIQTF